MARRDLNQRVTPEAVENFQIQPVATPVNKLEKFVPDVESAARTKSTYDALAQFGKGLIDVNAVWQRQAQENAIAAYDKTAEKNREDWAEVSKNFEGMEKFNPYNRDAYDKIRSAETTRKYINNLYADPELNARTPEEVQAFIENNQQDLLAELQAKGLKQKDYAQYLISYSNRAYALKQQHFKDNAEIEFKMFKNKVAEATADDIATAKANGGTIADAILNTEKMLDGLGSTPSTKAEIVKNSLEAYVAKNPEASSAEIEAFVQSYKINGESLSTYIPNMSVEMQKFVRQIKRANFEDEEFEFKVRDFRRKEALEQAQISFFDYMAKNPNATEEDIMGMALQCIQESGVEGEEGMAFLGKVASTKGYLQSIKEVISNQNELQKYTAQAIAGNLDYAELSQAVDGHVINYKDAIPIFSRDAQTKQQANTAFQKECTLLANTLKKGQPTYQTIGNDGAKEITGALTSIQDRVMRDDMAPEEAQKALRTIKDKVIPQMQYERQLKSRNKKLIVSGQHRRNQKISYYDNQKALEAIRNMGIVRNSQGVRKQNISINRGMTDDKNSDGIKGDLHIGTDVNGVCLGDKVYPPANGVVEMTGYEQSMGYYAVISTKKGYFLAMHLQPQFNKKVNEKISRNEYIGFVGNTGHVEGSAKTNGCLHIEFWDKDLNVINPYAL